MNALCAQVAFGIQGCHTAAARRGNGLAVNLILHVSRRKYASNIGL